MAVKFFLGCDLQGQPHPFTFTHEENGARRICQYMHDRLEGQREFYAVVANPCYTGSYLELNPDLVIISEKGIGVVELKHHFGEIDCGDPFGHWRAGGAPIEAGRGFLNPHQQVQSYAEAIRKELTASPSRWLPGDPAQISAIKLHTTICFTNPFARLEKCREAIQYRYQPGKATRFWEKFTVTTAAEIPDWAMDMRYEVLSEADWFRSYQLLPQEIEHLCSAFFHAVEWDEMSQYVRQACEPYGYLVLIDEARSLTLPPFRIDREEVWLGRNASVCHIVIPQTYSLVSNRHARLIYAHRRFYFEDLDSTNGSYLLGNPQPLSGLVELKPNQRVLLGDRQPGPKVCQLELRVERLIAERVTEQIQ
ncbi:MAG: NERD domain-containing protein [Anaerolineales bacterium]|nr:NERD domain-containing protein [Anaerolineales bacterium]